ncbi:MAG: DUF3857 domain-containing protein, partial [Aliifodinibius sp.]|nr:DUF3857 domain-containing protein [Fodinibius sp.]NIV15080.1 DUF3857 domain-containing protein [Fodinibius sp.]NIY23825.1 DUF3857 domain-containing protein [Fodinibius sp.]
YTERQKRPIIPDEWVAGFRFHYLHRNPGSLPPVRVDPVHQSRYNLQVPEGEKFQHQLRNIDISPAVKKEAGYVQYTWETNELPAIP